MNNAVFGDLIFNTGWKTETDVTLFDKTYKVVVKVKAYRETDGVTAGQELAYSDFCENRAARLDTIEKLLSNYAKDKAKGRFIPRTLLFNRDGSYAMLLDDREDEEGGVAATLAPESSVVAQDDYL